MTLALDGIRFLDLSRVLAGPFCGMLVADLGAEGIKFESPEGNDVRFFGRFVKGDSPRYRSFNRRKYVFTLELKERADRERLLAM